MAPTRVQLPDGNVGEFPATMKPEDIQAVLAKQFPPPPPPDMRNGLQRAFDTSTAPLSAEDRKGVPSLLNEGSDLGTGFINGVGSLAVHPLESMKGLAHAFAHPMDTAAAAGKAFDEHPGYTIGQTLGGVVGGGGVAGAADRGVSMAKTVGPELAERFNGYKSPVIPPALQSASKAAEAIRPIGGIAPDLEQNLMANLPRVKAYAEETGNPLHSQWEVGQASRELANKGLEHFKSSFLEPTANDRVVIGEGSPTLGHSATIGEINKRIGDINDVLRKATASSKTQGAQMSAEQQSGLEAEAGHLKGLLYKEIGTRTGVDPNVIRDLRQSYGQQFSLADTIDAARRARLGRTGAMEESGTPTPLTKAGLVDRFLDFARGGQEFVANGKLRRAMQDFQPAPQEYPTPNRPQNRPFQPMPASSEVLQRVTATGEPGDAVAPREREILRPIDGPMAKAPTVVESEHLAKAFQDEQNAAFHRKRAANQATAGRRLNGGGSQGSQ